MTKDFTDDPAVVSALHALQATMEAALATDGRKLHFIRLVASASDGTTPALFLGCDCPNCTLIAVETLAEASRIRRIEGLEMLPAARAH